jgi:hypothetical protein
MSTNCYRPGYERGPWHELRVLREHIAGREARGEDVTWYKDIYFSWLKYPEYARADQENIGKGFYQPLLPLQGVKEPATKQKRDINHVPPPDFDVSEVVLKHPGGRPRKSGELSRVTDWRRRKELQGVTG